MFIFCASSFPHRASPRPRAEQKSLAYDVTSPFILEMKNKPDLNIWFQRKGMDMRQNQQGHWKDWKQLERGVEARSGSTDAERQALVFVDVTHSRCLGPTVKRAIHQEFIPTYSTIPLASPVTIAQFLPAHPSQVPSV
jgi:hypothetical protein